MSEITDQIYVGSYGDASSEQYLSDRGITHVITCVDEFPSSIIRPGYRIPIVDDVADSKTKKILSGSGVCFRQMGQRR
jgi:hypothetical protein